MKKFVLLLMIAGAAQMAVAQGFAAQEAGATVTLARELARTDFSLPDGGARIEVKVTDDAARAVRTADLGSARHSITAYGVRLFSDSSQDGRANARAAMDRFAETNPGIEVNMSYEIPAFWVTAGHFVDRLDAVALCGRVLALFPRAFVVSMEVPVADIIARERIVPVLPAVPAAE